MNLNTELQQLNNRLDRLRRKLSAAISRNDDAIADEARKEIEAQVKRINAVKSQRERQVFKKTSDLSSLKFKRALTKAEQADLGKLKKSVKGLVVVHPLTALGRQMGLKEVTGFAPKAF
ncbi:YibL family ribosome-associated protein [Parasalinivibrio latis]|uniref:YibL family ribosome-associated protein n=1 Tax=Parasalinivibrio latis TaxID=2952610 RepID=UPI0030E0C280